MSQLVHLSPTKKSITRSKLMEKQSASQLMADNLQQLLEILGKQRKEDFHQQIRAIQDLGGLTKRWTWTWTWTSRMLNGGLRPVDLPIEVH